MRARAEIADEEPRSRPTLAAIGTALLLLAAGRADPAPATKPPAAVPGDGEPALERSTAIAVTFAAAIDPPVVGGDGAPAYAPALAVLPDGRAGVAWEERNGLVALSYR